jgi:hypothetical protein
MHQEGRCAGREDHRQRPQRYRPLGRCRIPGQSNRRPEMLVKDGGKDAQPARQGRHRGRCSAGTHRAWSVPVQAKTPGKGTVALADRAGGRLVPDVAGLVLRVLRATFDDLAIII